MTEQQLRNKKPRKILGNGSNVEFLNSENNLNLNSITNQQSQQHQLSNKSYCSSSNNNNLTFSTTPNDNTLTLKNLQQQQQQHQQQQTMERLRLANMMNQEMHALWPYGTATFLSPMLPTHNMALPYALAGTLPYAAVPIYQSLPNGNPQQCTVSPVSTSSSSASSSASTTNSQQQQQQQQSQNLLRSSLPTNSASLIGGASVPTANNQNLSNDSNKINIQIGLQCLAQNSPMNFNSITDSTAKVNLLNFCNSNQMADKDSKESNSSLRCSPILLSPEDSGVVIVNGAGGDAANSNALGGGSNGTVTLSQAKFNELTRLALRGSEIAEKLAYTHRNRPCFKKIDSLCARMKQDLIRPDGVLPNINSQGIAWAVKDFIFVFTRVINAWIIIKGYVYNTPEGLNKVKAALSPDFARSFAAWQDTTMDFIENLIKSFVNLDNLVQSQKNVYQKSDNGGGGGAARNNNNATPIKILQPVNSLLDESFDFLNSSSEKSQQNSLNKNYIYTMVEDSEGSQRQATVNGTYFKTGTYNPIKKDALLADQPTAVTAANSTPPSSSVLPSPKPPHLLSSNLTMDQYFDEQLTEFWSPSAAAAVDLEQATDLLKIKEKFPTNWLNCDLRVLEQNLTDVSTNYDPSVPPRPLGKDLVEKLNIMIERLMSMKTADLFFKIQFTKNYFPDFINKHKNDFMDVRSIVLKCQIGGYQHIYEVIHDVKKIIYTGKEFLKINNDAKLQKSITAFEVEFDKLLSEPPFENIQFEHITGEPLKSLNNYRK